MGSFFFIFLLIAIFGVFILSAGIKIISAVFRGLFGFKNPHRHTNANAYDSAETNNGRSTTRWYSSNSEKKKVFDDQEGEYVDFEEIKEENKK